MLLEEAPGDVILGIEQDQRAHQRAASGGGAARRDAHAPDD